MQALIRFSFDKMKELLFPFNLNRWLKILLIVWLAGAAGGGSGNWGRSVNNARQSKNINKPPFSIPNLPATPGPGTNQPLPMTTNSSTPPNQAIPNMPTPPNMQEQSPQPTGNSVSAINPGLRSDSAANNKKMAAARFKKSWPWLLAGFIFIGLPIMIVSIWLNSRFEFILLNFLTTQDLSIKASFVKYRELGNSILAFNWVLIASLLGFIGLALIPLLLGPAGKVITVLLLIVIAIPVTIGVLLVSDFVLPLMYHQTLKFQDSVRLFWDQDFDLGQIFIYYLVKMGLGIVAGIGLAIVSIIVLIAVGIPAGIAFVAALAMIKSNVALKVIGIIMMAVFGLIAFAAFIVAFGLIALPVRIFFQCFRLAFVTKLLPKFEFFMLPPTAT